MMATTTTTTVASTQAFEMDHSLNEIKQDLGGKKLSDSTASLSSSDSSSDLSSRIEDFELGLLRSNAVYLESSAHSDNGTANNEPQQRKKSVRFSAVQTREYNVVDELPSPHDHEDEVPRRSLGWSYSESQIDIEQHLQEVAVLKKERYARLIHEHIIRAEKKREESKNQKKKGWKARLKRALKPVGKSMLEAATRSNYMMAAAPL